MTRLAIITTAALAGYGATLLTRGLRRWRHDRRQADAYAAAHGGRRQRLLDTLETIGCEP